MSSYLPSLQIEDSRESKFKLVEELALREDLLPPVYILSHARADSVNTLRVLPALRRFAMVVVAEEELSAYRTAQGPDAELLAIPSGWGGHGLGLGRAKMFALDHARQSGSRRAILLDDDLTAMSALYSISEGKVSRALPAAPERGIFRMGLLVLFTLVMEEVFATDRSVVCGAPQTSNPERMPRAADMRWAVNSGRAPSQFVLWDLDRLDEYMPDGIDLDRFNRHGEDIAMTMEVLTRGGSVARVPSILTDWYDYETRSVIRTPATAPDLRQAEHDHLLASGWGELLRTRTDLLGRPQWHSPDWAALRDRGLAPASQDSWTDASVLDLF